MILHIFICLSLAGSVFTPIANILIHILWDILWRCQYLVYNNMMTNK
jgi:hypothetical protein